jgi:hypothetical protein
MIPYCSNALTNSEISILFFTSFAIAPFTALATFPSIPGNRFSIGTGLKANPPQSPFIKGGGFKIPHFLKVPSGA